MTTSGFNRSAAMRQKMRYSSLADLSMTRSIENAKVGAQARDRAGANSVMEAGVTLGDFKNQLDSVQKTMDQLSKYQITKAYRKQINDMRVYEKNRKGGKKSNVKNGSDEGKDSLV